MKGKVSRVTSVLLDEAGGSPEVMSQLVTNINSQRVIQPFLPVHDESPTMRFGKNVVATLNVCKKHSVKAGSAPDLLRRALIASGAEGPLSTNSVRMLNPKPCTLTLTYKYIHITLYILYKP